MRKSTEHGKTDFNDAAREKDDSGGFLKEGRIIGYSKLANTGNPFKRKWGTSREGGGVMRGYFFKSWKNDNTRR